MSDVINANKDVPTTHGNIIPCHIQYSGVANTKDYFTPSKKQETLTTGEKVEVAYFRGCRLLGKNVNISNDYNGYLINKSESLAKVDDETSEDYITVNTYTPVARFEKFTVYGHDTIPELTNQWGLIQEWKEISDLIHS
mmetsp:Transcript_1479/g.1600  ORF Transcript_1479/g.1600 Transcript_1479/m.1600 type:complete len:139 (+) Transcript_1479:23-439(+)